MHAENVPTTIHIYYIVPPHTRFGTTPCGLTRMYRARPPAPLRSRVRLTFADARFPLKPWNSSEQATVDTAVSRETGKCGNTRSSILLKPNQ